MSALSVPPSQKSNLSIGQDPVDNYTNTLTRITLAEAGQCSVVAFYTEVEVRASDLDAESPEIQVQTECYEEEIVALSAGVSGGGEEETGEAAGVAKALETLTKTFALRKESLGSETGPLYASDETKDKTERTTEDDTEMIEAVDNYQPVVHQDITNDFSEAAALQEPDICTATCSQTGSPRWQEMEEMKMTAGEKNDAIKTYRNIPAIIVMSISIYITNDSLCELNFLQLQHKLCI